MTTPRYDRLAVETAMCPYCHARPGQRCRTVKPRAFVRKGIPTAIHTPRLRPIVDGYTAGYQDARKANR